VPSWAGRFIGIPYQDDGYDFDGCNCFGIVHLVLKHQARIEIDPQADVSADDVARATERALSVAGNAPWQAVNGEPRLFDVALLRGNPLHTGIVIAPRILLHVWRSPMSVAMSFDNPRLRTRFIAFYRHAALA
jgi:hypothetical protein